VQCTLTAPENARLAQEQNPDAKPFLVESKKQAAVLLEISLRRSGQFWRQG